MHGSVQEDVDEYTRETCFCACSLGCVLVTARQGCEGGLGSQNPSSEQSLGTQADAQPRRSTYNARAKKSFKDKVGSESGPGSQARTRLMAGELWSAGAAVSE